MSLIQRIVGGTKAMLVAEAARIATKGAIVLLLTRVFFTPDEYGLLFFALSVLGVGLLAGNLGLAKSAARYVAEYRERDPSQVEYILRTTLSVNLAAVVVVAAALGLLDDPIAALLGEPRLAPFLLVGGGYVAARSLQTFVSLGFQGLNRVTRTAAVVVVAHVSIVAGVVGFLLLGLGPLGAFYGYVAGYAAAAIVGLALLGRHVYATYGRTASPEAGLRRRILEYNVPLTVTHGANTLDKKVDTILVGFFLTPAAVGFYTLGRQVADIVGAPAASLGFSVAPALGEQKAREDVEHAAWLYERTFEYTLALYVPATVGLVIVAEPAIRFVFGRQYLAAVPVLQVLSLFLLPQAIEKTTSDGLDYLGRARERAYAKSTLSVANFLLNLVMIPLFGVVGAAGATVMTHSALAGFFVYVVHRELRFSLASVLRVALTVGAISGGMALVVALLVPYVSGVVSLTAVILAGVLTWLVLATASGVIDLERLQAVLT